MTEQSGMTEDPAPTTNGKAPDLRVENIHTFYGAIEALKGITIEVQEG
jgi:ABC-type sugar transport system ATPase subunit